MTRRSRQSDLAVSGRVIWLLAAATILLGPTSAAADAPRSASLSDRAVVVELFTAQGCSFCPAAERLLTQLESEAAGRVVALEFHIDSWNSLGWTDPFSRAEWTRRQEAYARARSAKIYTPQAFVDGSAELEGNNEQALRAAITAAAAAPAPRISLVLEPAGDKIRARVEVTRPEALQSRTLDLMLAVYENGLVTEVRRGENGGRTLNNNFVVRSLRRGARLTPGEPRQSHSEILSLAKGWKRSAAGVVAFLQDPKSLEIHGAVAQPLPPPAAPGK